MKSFVLILGLFLVSCSLNDALESPPISYQELFQCHEEEHWTKEELEQAILGRWKWKYIACFWVPEDANGVDYKGMEVVFKADHTVDVLQNNRLRETATWEIESNHDGIFYLNSTPPIEELAGTLFLCKKNVSFINSFVDGCDNFFQKRD